VGSQTCSPKIVVREEYGAIEWADICALNRILLFLVFGGTTDVGRPAISNAGNEPTSLWPRFLIPLPLWPLERLLSNTLRLRTRFAVRMILSWPRRSGSQPGETFWLAPDPRVTKRVIRTIQSWYSLNHFIVLRVLKVGSL